MCKLLNLQLRMLELHRCIVLVLQEALLAYDKVAFSHFVNGFVSLFCICFRAVTFDKDITPYIHVFVYHTGDFAMKYGALKAFEMEAVEQLNYVNKLVFFRCSNHGKEQGTITEQIIQHSTRTVVSHVQNLKRLRRPYTISH